MRIVTVAVLAAGILPAGDASAFEIRVRASAELEVQVDAAGTVAQVSGTLRDDLGRGVPQRPLKVQIDARSSNETVVTHDMRTDARGQFSVHHELAPGDYEVFVRFDESDHLDGIATSRSVRLEPHAVDVRAFGPAFVYGTEAPAIVSARAAAGPIPFQGEAEVVLRGDVVGEIDLDTTGRGTFDVSPHLEEGVNVVTVRTPASAYRDASEASLAIRHTRSVRVEARLEERLVGLSRGVAVQGAVADELGPIGGVRVRTTLEAVSLVADTEPGGAADGDSSERDISVTVVTDDSGQFVGFVESSRLRDGIWRGEAEFLPPLGDGVSVSAGEVEIDTRAYEWAVNGFGALALLVGLLALVARLGTLAYERYLSWQEARARERREREALEDEETIVPVFLDDEDATEIPTRQDSTVVAGLVWDVWRRRPIASAEIELSDGARTIARTADARGRFRFENVPHGNWTLRVTRFGFMPGTMALSVPHEGRLANFRIDVVAVPLKIRRLYSTVVEHEVGEDLWGRWSPREIEARIDEAFADVALETRRRIRALVLERLHDDSAADVSGRAAVEALTEVVEEAYFSGRTYGEEAFRFARSLALEVRGREEGPA